LFRWPNRVVRRRIIDAAGRKIGSQVSGPLPEPELHPFFCVRQPVVQVRQESSQVRRELELVRFCDHHIPEAYCLARRPMPRADQVLPLPVNLKEIRLLAHELKHLE
jgi:hypothetical protein